MPKIIVPWFHKLRHSERTWRRGRGGQSAWASRPILGLRWNPLWWDPVWELWLVGGLEHEFYFFHIHIYYILYWEFHHPNWLDQYFSDGQVAQPPTRWDLTRYVRSGGWFEDVGIWNGLFQLPLFHPGGTLWLWLTVCHGKWPIYRGLPIENCVSFLKNC